MRCDHHCHSFQWVEWRLGLPSVDGESWDVWLELDYRKSKVCVSGWVCLPCYSFGTSRKWSAETHIITARILIDYRTHHQIFQPRQPVQHLYCTTLFCTTLILYNTILYNTILYNTYTVHHFTVKHYTVQHYNVQHYTVHHHPIIN